MIRSLWTAASGMISQQTNVDVIANNISNINTSGFKRETPQFKTLLYQTIQEDPTNNTGANPLGIQVGLGVRNSAIRSEYTQGVLSETGNTFDFAIEGNGFFMVELPNGETAYTRNGSFRIAAGYEANMLVNSEGYPILDMNGSRIVFNQDIDINKISIDEGGNFIYNYDDINYQILHTLGLAQFNNPAGLSKMSGSLLTQTPGSGNPRIEAYDNNLNTSKVRSGYLEGSNVDAANEMVDLIVAQRAYEMNSKAIQASDEMLQLANNLRR